MKTERLFSLDLLRGLDMFVFVARTHVVWAAHDAWGLPQAFVHQFTHPWGGFTFNDIIMPLFIFMCGAAIPLAVPKRLTPDGRPTAAFWKHLVSRVAMLWIFGMIVQGHLLTLDPMKISPYNNTLQTIAFGSFFASLAYLCPKRWIRPAIAVGCFVVYGLIMAFCGDYSQDGNAAQLFEQAVLRHLVPAGSEAFKTGTYTWFLTGFMFVAMSLCGSVSTEILQNNNQSGWRKAGTLAAAGLGELAIGWLLVLRVPMIKQFFSVSFTLQAMGWCTLALAALYALTDVLRFRRGFSLFLLYGRHALFAYMLANVFGKAFETAAEKIACADGLALHFGKPFSMFAGAIAYVVLLTAFLKAKDASAGR